MNRPTVSVAIFPTILLISFLIDDAFAASRAGHPSMITSETKAFDEAKPARAP
jgi:hypothetical protein